MRAAYHLNTGGPEVLQIGELPDPVCAPNDVLIRVHASSIDRIDIYSREGSHGVVRATPYIGGRDIAGAIVEIGAEAAKSYPALQIGMLVVAFGSFAHAELAVAPAELTFPVPHGCSIEAAAALPTAGRTAFDALVNRLRIRPGEDVLVIAGGSGVGSFGIQIAKAAGCRVFTTVGTEDKKQAAIALGADVAIDHYKEDVVARIREMTGGLGVHAVLDHVGTPMWDAAFKSLRPYGRFVTTGVTAGHRVSLHLGELFVKGIELHGIGRPDNHHVRKAFSDLLRLVEQGKVTPVIHAIFPLAQIADAHRLMESSSFFGKIVLTIEGSAAP